MAFHDFYRLDSVISVSDYFEPDVSAYEEFYPDSKGRAQGGERRLMAAMLSDGIESYIALCVEASKNDSNPGQRINKKLIDAKDWVETKDDSYVFSFDNVCFCLGLNPDYIRIGLMKFVEASISDPSKIWKKVRRPRKRI